jgi:hypothetical protein
MHPSQVEAIERRAQMQVEAMERRAVEAELRAEGALAQAVTARAALDATSADHQSSTDKFREEFEGVKRQALKAEERAQQAVEEAQVCTYFLLSW